MTLTTRGQWYLLAILAVMVPCAGCGEDNDPIIDTTGFGGAWLASPAFARNDPWLTALVLPTEPILITEAGSTVIVTTLGDSGQCVETAYNLTDNIAIFGGAMTLPRPGPPCGGPGGGTCELTGTVTYEMTRTGGSFTGSMSGSMVAVPGTGCLCNNSTFNRPVEGVRCGSCWPGCSP